MKTEKNILIPENFLKIVNNYICLRYFGADEVFTAAFLGPSDVKYCNTRCKKL